MIIVVNTDLVLMIFPDNLNSNIHYMTSGGSVDQFFICNFIDSFPSSDVEEKKVAEHCAAESTS